MSEESKIFIVEDTSSIINLLSKIITLDYMVNTFIDNMDIRDSDAIAIEPFSNSEIDTIDINELKTTIPHNIEPETYLVNTICEAVINSSIDNLRTFKEIKPLEILLENGINEVLIFQIIFDDSYKAENFPFLNELKDEISRLFMECVNSVLEKLFEYKIVDNYRYVGLHKYILGGIAIYCSNTKLKVLEER